MSIEAELAKKLFSPKNREEAPYILCRRNVPHVMTYQLHDTTWEGLRRTTRNGQTQYEIDHNFVLTIELDGTCKIPDTPNNQKRLSWISKPLITKATKKVFDYVTGVQREEEIEITEPPLYERIEDNLIEENLVARLAQQVRELMANPKADMNYLYAEEETIEAAQDTNVKPLAKVRKVEPFKPEYVPDDLIDAPPEVFEDETPVANKPKPGRPKGRRIPE